MTVTTLVPGAVRAKHRRALVINSVAASLLVIALNFAHGLAISFLYDAAQYWNAPMALVSGGDAAQAGALSMRGAVSVLVYFPPALVSSAIGSSSAAWAVLVWNSFLAVAVCVFLFPRIASLVSPGNIFLRLWLSALIGGVLLSGFAPYPLLDTWAVFAALAGLYALVKGRHWWTAVIGGIAWAVSVNLRPSYVVPMAIVVIILLFARPRRIAWAVPGIVAVLVPQYIVNLAYYGRLGVVPWGTSSLARVQAAQASYAIRYDTVLYLNRNPQQWFCDPVYASQVIGDAAPKDQLGVVASVIEHLPYSLWFLSEKAAASLQWSFVTPYEHDPNAPLSLTTLLVVAVASMGIVALFVRSVFARRDRARFIATLTLVGFWLGSLAALVLSTPETRFAIPLVVIGLIGVIAGVPRRIRDIRPSRALVIAIAGSILLAAAVFAAGTVALAHPAMPGELKNARVCATL